MSVPQTALPQKGGSWPISTEELKVALELGRLLTKTILDFGKKNGGLHLKVLSGALQYVQDLQEEKKYTLTNDIVFVQKLVEENGFGDKILEPFAENLREETAEEKIQRAIELRKMADTLDEQKPNEEGVVDGNQLQAAV